MPEDEQAEPVYSEFEGDLVRERLLNALRFDLLGPEDDHEVLAQSPKTRYLVGMLSPRNTEVDASEDDQNLAQGEGDEAGDGKVAVWASLEASSIGLSVVVDGGVETIVAKATWGEYHKEKRLVEEPIDPEDALDLDPDADPDAVAETVSKEVTEWRREPKVFEVVIPLDDSDGQFTEDSGTGVTIHALIRKLGDDRVVSIFLDNVREAPLGERPPDQLYLYQPRLELSGDGEPFVPRSSAVTGSESDPDIVSADLIYRNRLEFGVGHGVSANWIEADGGRRAAKIFTEIMPSHEVSKVTPRESDRLSMDFLAEANKSATIERLNEFMDDYESWIFNRSNEAEALATPHSAAAKDHVSLQRRSLSRMRTGIDAIEDETVFSAFRFANRAMALQRRHSVRIIHKRRGEPVPKSDEIAANWRPFQLGFILQSLAGLADPTNDDREVADLLWFPTGGGKTEAYLGLTAFILALRRLRPDGEFNSQAGTAVIMRYTLRLLTIQQFQRALTLIVACEHIRTQDEDTWGEERFTIGLWVGQSVTPNSYADAKTALNKLKSDQVVYEKSPYQVLFCPWCGEDIDPKNYVSDDETERTYIKCWNSECDFHTTKAEEGIPALVVDAEIYRNPPSLLLATVDKFAQMAWNGRIQTLFGRVDRYCDRHGWISTADEHASTHQASAWADQVVVTKVDRLLAPPDLIIQDELHLISGPLGTLVGIYEAVIDSLCSYDVDGQRVRPKVVASTATVRRASTQVASLFDRQISVFPPLGIDAEDSYFATEDSEQSGRLYVGVFGPGRSIKTTLVRTYAALLGRSLIEHGVENSAESDAYMTLVGYFNSLRELGGAVRLVEDDVRSRLRTLKRRGFSDDRVLYEAWELTSRKSSSRISDTLDALNRTFIDIEKGAYPIDVLLASNMISVGVDIDRLGLMVVSGQPKTTAEYIQATSRVGRAHPGLIVQVYNWVRPRDISHYERFHHYHDTFYRHVEATSVTPFSDRARDRALPAVLVAHSRLDRSDWSTESGAANFASDDPSVVKFAAFLVERARRVARHGDEVADELRKQIDDLLFTWDQLTHDPNGLVYSRRGQNKKETDESKKRAVLMRPMELDTATGEWKVAGSLREVEEEVPIVLKEYEGGGV